MGPQSSSLRISLPSQKLWSMNSHVTKCTIFSKGIRRWLTTVTFHTLPVYMWSLRKYFTFSKRNKFKFVVKRYIIAHCSQSSWKTHMRFEFKRLHAWKMAGMFKAVTIVIWFQSRCWFDLLFTKATSRKKDCQS